MTGKPMIGEHDKNADARANDTYFGKKPQVKLPDGDWTEPKVIHAKPVPDLRNHKPADTFETEVHLLFRFAENLLLDKHKAYGPLNIAQAPGGPLNGLRVRMWDKFARINNLIDNDPENKFESLRDSFVDLANYALIAILVLDGNWPGVDNP
jgi:hypothetical protein